MDYEIDTGAIYTEDQRDYEYALAGAPETLPASYKTDTSMFPVLMQGKRPSCVSHAWVRLLQIYWYKKTGQVVNFSPRFLHAMTADGMPDSAGRNPRNVGNVLLTKNGIGCCTTDLLPNDVSLNDHEYSHPVITQAMLDEAKQYTIPAYSFVPIDQYAIRHAIYHKGAVALLFQVGKEWWTPSWLPKDINPLRPPQVVISGHEVTGEHWSDLDGIQNSWSDQWNEKGFGEYDIANYKPLQAICIDDPTIDFNHAGRFLFTKDLHLGMTDPDVLQLQIRLGFVPKYQTGYFGPITKAAVIAYQKANNISPAEGYVGPITRAKLNG